MKIERMLKLLEPVARQALPRERRHAADECCAVRPAAHLKRRGKVSAIGVIPPDIDAPNASG